jgi:GTPase SAR1 family protein
MENSPFNYDVFISHSSKDKPTVRDLAERLRADGLRVWFDEWEIQPGDMIPKRIIDGLDQSRVLVLCMSATFFASEWGMLESYTSLFRDPTNQQRRFIPLRLDDAVIKDTLKQFAYVDWRQKSHEQYARLLATCRPPAPAVQPSIKHKGKSQPNKVFKGHTSAVSCVDVTPNGRRVVSGSGDNTVRVWDAESGKCLAILEGHTNTVWGVSITASGRRVVSGSNDGTVRVWELPNYYQKVVAESEATRYTNAKVLLVGETGVGKSGLAYRLTEDRFVPTISTDGVWATQLKLPHETGTRDIEREIWLWDFAGQTDYRLIHQLFMDETSLAVLIFNPQSENPFEGLGEWDRDLQRAARRPFKKLLVAGRGDRGGLMVSRASIERFCQERGFTHYLETSAYTGSGCDSLREAIINNIPWDDIPWTASPRIFKLLKEEIVKLKDEGKVLLRMGELKQQLEMRLSDEAFTLDQLRAVVGLLAGPGVVWKLEFGDFVLLHPDRINAYAAAVIRKVRAHTEEIGIILEEDVIAGRLDYQDMKRLPADEEQIVLRAMHQTFIDHGLCLREPTESGTLLVFPSYFKRERPKLEGHPAALVTYQFNGQLDEIYSTLVVQLHHTPTFEKDQLWRFAADFKTVAGKRVGVKMNKQGEGSAEIVVYFEPGIADDTKVTFIRYVHEHLKVKAQGVVRLRHYVCPHCDTPVENRRTALDRLERGLKDIICVNCEKRIPLWDLIEQKFASEEFQQRVRELEEQARISIDNESRELILVGHAYAIAGEAGQIFRGYTNSDHGIDGEIEFKNDKGEASGKRVYLQLKSGDSYLQTRLADGTEVFNIRRPRYAEYWLDQAYPVILVVRTSEGEIRWMDVTDYLKRHGPETRQVVFDGEPFTALSLVRLRDRLIR